MQDALFKDSLFSASRTIIIAINRSRAWMIEVCISYDEKKRYE